VAIPKVSIGCLGARGVERYKNVEQVLWMEDCEEEQWSGKGGGCNKKKTQSKVRGKKQGKAAHLVGEKTSRRLKTSCPFELSINGRGRQVCKTRGGVGFLGP